MKLIKTSVCVFMFTIWSCYTLSAQSTSEIECTFTNKAFHAGEQLTYLIQYNWGLIWVDAGEAVFSVKDTIYNKKVCYYFLGMGHSFPKYDWFYKVRDRFETFMDTMTLKPLRYVRNSNEAGNQVYNDNYFNFAKSKAIYYSQQKDKSFKKDTVAITQCTYDVLSMVYYSRNIDFSKYKPNDKIPVSLYLDGEIYSLYIRYVGKENIKTKTGSYDCIKFKPLLIEGTIFKGGENMTVWVTDDEQHLPVYVETPIVVGSIKVTLTKAKGLK